MSQQEANRHVGQPRVYPGTQKSSQELKTLCDYQKITIVYLSTQHRNQETDTASCEEPGVLTRVYPGVQRGVLGVDSLCTL